MQKSIIKTWLMKLHHLNKYLIISSILAGFFVSKFSLSAPAGGEISAGNAVISHPTDTQTRIDQSSNKAVIDWKSFNVNQNEQVHFVQPSPSSIILNRINPNFGVSKIYGVITANGQVWLVNPAGIWFGPNSYVNVGGLVATTASISTRDFMNGQYHFVQSPDWQGAVINEGLITIHRAGLAALVGVGAVNDGKIMAKLGTVVLGAANEYTIHFDGNPMVQFAVGNEVTQFARDQNGNLLKNAVKNSGTIIANGGHIVISANVASKVLDHAINMNGVLEAKSIGLKGGDIILDSHAGVTRVSGKINVNGKRPNEKGGTVKILGSTIKVRKNAFIDASGDAGGGTILIGGNLQGKGPEPNAHVNLISKGAVLNANALTSGDGGLIVVYSDGYTKAFGDFSARGGKLFGNGGLIETSGLYLDVNQMGRLDVTATKGEFGTWLLDPSNVTINNSSTVNMNFSSGTYSPALLAVLGVNLNAGDLGTRLNTANVKVITTNVLGLAVGDITLNDTANQLQTNWGNTATTLTLQADNNIIFSSALTLNGTGKGLTLNASGSISLNNTIDGSINLIASAGSSFTASAALGGSTALSSINITAPSGIAINTNTITTTGSQTYNNAVTLGTSSTLTGGTISLPAVSLGANTLTINTSASNSSVSGVISGTGGVTKAGSGTLTLSNAANTYTGATTINVGILSAGTLANAGSNSSLGAASGASAIINIGSSSAGTLSYTGGTVSTNRGISIGGTGGGTIQALTNGATLTLSGNIATNGNPLTFDTNTATILSSGIISGSGSLTKTSSGILNLNGANIYSGATALNAGKITVTHASGLGSSAVTVASGANLDLNFNSSTLGDTNTISLSGTGSGTGALTFSGNSIILNAPLSLNANTTIGGTGSGTITLGGLISGASNLIISLTNAGISLPAITLISSSTLSVTTGGAITQTGLFTIPGTASFNAGANPITLTQNNLLSGAVTLSTTGANDATINNNTGLTLAASSVGRKLTATSTGTITLSGSLTANATGDSIVLAGARFDNSGAFSLTPGGSGRFLVWSSNANPFGGATPDNRGGLTYNFKQYNATYGATTVLGTGNGFLYTLAPSITPVLTGTVSKSYDANTTATLAGSNYSSSGAVNGDTITLNNPTNGTYDTKNAGTGKNVSVSGIAIASATDGAATVYGYQLSSSSANANIGTITPASLSVSSNAGQSKIYGNDDPASAQTGYGIISGTLFGTDTLSGAMGRVSGENVGSYNFTQNTVAVSDGNGGNNYSLTFNGSSNPFQINARSTTGSIANQSKIYGANDPTLSGMTVTLGNIVNRNVTDINGNVTPINDTSNVATTLASLTRTAGELVSGSPYNISAATFNTLTGSAAANYNAPSFTGTPTLTINAANLTASIANQTKTYGADDPTLSGIGVTLGGVINRTISTWNGNVAVNDTGNVAATLASLTRTAGELVSGSPYSISAATFNTLTGTAAANYNAPSFAGNPTLTITQANLTGSIANQTKTYGADDPTLSGIGVTLGGVINRTISTWNGNVAVNDSGNVTTSLASLTRSAGELVSGSPYSITAASFNALTGSAAANYNAPSFTGTPTLTINAANLTASIANQTKTYGADDPTLSGIGVNLNGVINRTISTWNGIVAVNDAGNVATSLASLTRSAGELVSGSPYNISAATFNTLTGSAAGNYNAPSFTGTPTLTINPANLTGSIANQTKTYGADDPTLSGIGVNLNGVINRTISTWNGNVAVNDSGNVAATLASLTRTAGELVSGSPYNINAATFNTLTGSAAANYNAPSFIGSPTLTITQANLTGSIANQTKTYGADDPTLSGISVNLNGVINRTISTWNGSVIVNDTGNVATTLASLTRTAGELVSGSPYNISAATFNALTGTAAGNYNAPSFAGSPTLTINPANLTASIANQSKTYGADDPTLSGIGVNLNGVINRTINTWNGNVAVNDTGNVAATLSSLTRTAGELVSGSPYNISAATFNTLTGSAAANYNAPSFTGTSTLTINPANLTGSIANQTKTYGADDPTLSGIGVNLNGVINRTISTWNGNVAVNDAGNVAATLASLTRTAGELVSGSPYSISAATFNILTGSAAANYNAPSFTGTPTLTINAANLTGSIANQTKTYGADDPTLSGIGVTLGGVINRTISTWNGSVAVNDSGNVTTSLASLTRTAGELVLGSPYDISAATFNTLTGTAAANYNSPSFTGTPTLTINAANLTGSIANQTKTYGADDPTLSGIGVTLGGVINRTISTWNGSVIVNDTGNVATTLASLTRSAGELVSGSPYSITAATFNTLTGTAAANYTAPSFTGTPTLTITQANLTGSIANQTKTYGADDPTLSGIGVTLGGVINRTISTWNGNVAVDDTGNVTTSLASLTRTAGELVSGSPYNISAATFNTLTGTAAANYNAPSFTGSPTLTINPANLTGSIANQTKTYGADDPTLSGIGVTLGGVINRTINTWNGSVAVNDSGNVATTLASLTRAAGELVSGSPYNISAATFNTLTGSAAANYNAPSFIGSPTLTITQANLTGSIANQTKTYGADDPTLSGIGVTLGGVINRTISTWNGNVAVNDSGNVATTLASLTRAAGELVSGSPYNISAATFNALTGSAAGNYNAPNFTGSPTLTINPANLTGSIANQTKTYGADDPTLSGIGVNLNGVINRTISTWNGNVAVNDSGNVATTLASLTRTAGELVSGSPYSISVATFNALTGSAAANYNAPSFTGTPTLTINPANLTGSIANQTKTYGADDPTLSGIGVTLGGVINRSISTWNGNVAVNDSGNVATTLSSLTRTAGELVSGSPYNISAATFNTLTGSAAANYNAPSFTGTPTLTINAANLTASIANQTKTYGADDPTLSGIGVTLGGVINRTISTWNGNVAVNDSGNVATTLASLTRAAGELVSGSPYNISAATFNALTGSAAANYNAPSFTGSPTLTINPANLTVSIANQTKTYGADDPTLSGIGVSLNGVINRTISTWNGNVAVNDSGNVATTLASLTRTAGELVSGSPYSISAATFNALTGTAAANYNAPSFTGTPTLTIDAANLTGSIANQTKTYGADDPTLSGIGVNLNGVINRTISTWNGSVIVNDTGNVAATLASLTRMAGEVVSGSPYNISAATFNTLTGSAATNYNAPSFTGTPTLTINAANLTGSIANQTKTYGADDPTLSGIGVTLGGVINRTISTWNGNVAVNDSGNVATTLASLTRAAGELVSGSPYSISAATFNALTGTAAGNYNAPSFTGTPTLTINPANLTGSIANQTKTYGADDPTLSGIGVTLGGVINRTISTWNGSVAVNDSGNVAATLASLTRTAGELVSGSPYNISAATFNTLTGSAAENYNAPSLTGTPTLTINAANLTGSIANQTKTYGADDPTLSGIGVSLNGVINTSVTNWMGNTTVINDTNQVFATPLSLARIAGESISNSPYPIISGTFNLSGNAANNYNVNGALAGSPVLIINPANLSASLSTFSKIYGTSDPVASSVPVTLGNVVNRNVTNWMGSITPINDDGNVSITIASYTRAAGENVANSPYLITGETFNSLSGAAAINYVAPISLSGSPALAILPAPLTINNISANNKIYNGNTQTSLNLASAALSGVIASDEVAINPNFYQANFISANPGKHIPVMVTQLGIQGASAENYYLVQPTNLSADIFAVLQPSSVQASYNIVFSPLLSEGSVSPNIGSELIESDIFSPADMAGLHFDRKQILQSCVKVTQYIDICRASLSVNKQGLLVRQ